MTNAETAAPTSTATSTAPPRYGPIGTAADQCIRALQRGYRDDRPYAVAALARLRRGAGRQANDLTELWGQTGTEQLAAELAVLPDDERRRVDFDRADQALHLVTTLWALHQQSHRDANMHVASSGLGRAVRELMRAVSPGGGAAGESSAQDLDEPIRRRFVRVGNAGSLDMLGARLREVVQLLRNRRIPLDYALLAEQLYRWQNPAQRADVRRAWGRDFHLAAMRRKPEAGDKGAGSS
ncbi:type I-E CRISPR-associated protein Cse2/CasB [Streptomyces sp. HPF1205]|uniref:type I-E CRISPR-associated protein Cse2/CasB n=1 Tax=Streptomyces sp. HPF1205 TaxID=2873262 RepID=UPI001CED4D76|nr:type I-E CRISPR-associated protein Cse2/CasB [Streptomyces sp. HPF1205]